MDHALIWDPVSVCEMGPGHLEDGTSCCGVIKEGDPCKISIKRGDLKGGRQKLRNLAESPFDLTNLRLILCDIVSHFLCVRWHRQQQVDQVGQKWYAAAPRNQDHIRVPPNSQASISGVERRPLRSAIRSDWFEPDGPHQPVIRNRIVERAIHTGRQPVYPTLSPATSTPSQEGGGRVTADMVQQRQIPWQVSQESPAILSVSNDRAGEQTLEIKSFSPGSETDSIECGIRRSEEDDESVTLHCAKCTFIVHLGCMDSWLRSRTPGYHPTCHHW